MNEPWTPPEPPADNEPLISLDPRVITAHQIGVLPCPKNPPPPVGWQYWKAHVTSALGVFASGMLNDAKRYPMGAFVQAVIDGKLVAARVEWHDFQGKSGKKGCFRGVNLMHVSSELHAAAGVTLARGAKGSAVVDLQQRLNAAGAAPVLKADGDFGEKTEKAVKAFQLAHAIGESGVVDQVTWAALAASN